MGGVYQGLNEIITFALYPRYIERSNEGGIALESLGTKDMK